MLPLFIFFILPFNKGFDKTNLDTAEPCALFKSSTALEPVLTLMFISAPIIFSVNILSSVMSSKNSCSGESVFIKYG